MITIKKNSEITIMYLLIVLAFVVLYFLLN